MDFDKSASHWDTEYRINRARRIAEEITRALAGKPCETAMEYGCGTGLISSYLQAQFLKLTLVDSSKGMLEVANAKICSNGWAHVTTVEADLSEKDALDSTFDVIYSSMVLHHVRDVRGLLQNLHTKLNSGGHLILVDLDTDDGRFHRDFTDFDGHHGFDQQVLADMLTTAGFTDVRSHTFFRDVRLSGGESLPYSLFLMVAKS